MRVQRCPHCGVGYKVERLSDGSVFDCRRCGAKVEVGRADPPAGLFSLGLLLAGTLALAALFLYANPQTGVGESQWPWEVAEGDVPWSTRLVLGLWALAGLWALVSSLGFLPRTRGVITIAIVGVLLIVCCGSLGTPLSVATLADGLPSLHLLLAMVAVGSGLVLLGRAEHRTAARALAFGGGIALVWYFAFRFEGQTSEAERMVEQTRLWLGGDLDITVDAWQTLLPSWLLLLAGVVGVVVGFGAQGPFFTWTGVILLVGMMVVPAVAELVEEAEAGVALGDLAYTTAGADVLVRSGLTLWMLATYGVADLIRHRRRSA